MAPTKEYALLCLENPLLGMFSLVWGPVNQKLAKDEIEISADMDRY